MDKNIMDLIYVLSTFVKKTCAGRDKSHGHHHMRNVAKTSLLILIDELHSPSIPENKKVLVLAETLIVAWLHDVADHKYDKDGKLKLKVEMFVNTCCSDNVGMNYDMILKTIDMISFSKENGSNINFNDELGTYYGFIRNVVSDADKLEALGKSGLDRCIEYSKVVYKEKHGVEIPNDILKQSVIDHANEKLLRLKDEFIRTKLGKQLAEKLHKELVEELALM